MDDERGASADPAPVRRRDRHGRGVARPRFVPPPGARDPRPSRGRRFDAVVLGVVGAVDAPWRARLGALEYAVEDTPLVPDDWPGGAPLASLVPAREGRAARIVLFRRPLERRAPTRIELELLVRQVVAEQLAELLGISPEDVDPDYDPDF
ncbi:metallopeptidase family protein [Nocardioides zeae]|uniref:Metallopeptidase family protein n=1 Tax=Nocardioides imazamoxiresistens TaxID=3231893 RepID=A0ABU3Q1L7_9ACTN|nr:metallopeptidase family protein [Nocardioides zeae]MDT9594927.1 metallopeptidase family protein [Nocardioides zeae]